MGLFGVLQTFFQVLSQIPLRLFKTVLIMTLLELCFGLFKL